jgi:hypothetical protein
VPAIPRFPNRLAWYIGIALGAMLVPVALALAVFPTAMGDLSENVASGRWFPLTTPEHPPMQVWLTGLVALVLPPNAVTIILAGQAFNLVGVFYVWRTLLLIVDPVRAAMFAFLFATTIYFIGAPLSWALNADIIQIPMWAGVVYHLMRAARTNRWLHWLGFALWMTAAVYTKFSAAILVAGLVVAAVVVPEYRRQWLNPRFWAASVLGVLIALPYLKALVADPSAIANAAVRVGEGVPFLHRVGALSAFVQGFAVFLLPGWAILLIGLLKRDFRFVRPSAATTPDVRFLRWTFLGCAAVSVAMIFGIGLTYLPRFDAPLFGLAVSVAAPLIEIDRARWPATETRVLGTSAIVAVVTFVAAAVAYTLFTSHDNMQEPLPEATAIMRADWDKHYACGPAYYLGDRRTAHGMSISADRVPVGIPLDDIRLVHWFDPELLRERGAIMAFSGTSFPAEQVAKALPGSTLTAPQTFTLPLLRTRTGGSVSYSYAFIAPGDC